MPRSMLSARRVAAGAGRSIGPGEWAELLFPSKAEFQGLEGDDGLVVESTADRLDLLCDGGLGLHLAGALGSAVGAVPIRPGPAARSGRIRVDPSVAPIRPAIAAVEVTAPGAEGLDEGLLSEAIRFQELLHATLGFDRRLASFGLYAAERLRGPLEYTTDSPDRLRFTPLEGDREVRGTSFLLEHPMALRYAAYGVQDGRALVLRDADGAVLSLPPILNAEGPGSVRAGDRAILLESTGTRSARVSEGVGLLMLPFVAAGWSVTPVPIAPPDGGAAPPGPLDIHRVTLRRAALDALAGSAAPPEAVTEALARARLDPAPVAEGWTVPVPPWRPDLLGEVDLAEEAILARGLDPAEGRLLPSPTRGHRRSESRFRDRVAELLLGMGFTALFTTVLVPSERCRRIGRAEPLTIANPVSEEVAVVRDRLLPSLLGALSHNVRHGYPQRIGEVGPAVERDDAEESGGRTSYRAAFVEASDRAGFADAAARVDALLRAFGALGVREPAEVAGLLPGRAAVLRVAGETVAELGELRPDLLEAERIPVPVAYGEIDLTALWPLVRRA